MPFSNLPLAEREERARRVHVAIHEFGFVLEFKPLNEGYSESDITKLKDQFDRKLSVPSRLGKLFHAVVLIRENHTLWEKYLHNPSQSPPHIFESFIGDKLLVFFLFFSDRVSLFHLDPRFQFVNCDLPPSPYGNDLRVSHYRIRSRGLRQENDSELILRKQLIVRRKTDYDSQIVKSLVKMYFSLGSPLRHTLLGEYMVSAAESLKNPESDELASDYMDHLNTIARAFGFSFVATVCKGASTSRNSHTYFNMGEFVREASVAIAYDCSEINTLENIHKLFPQYEGLIGAISREYVVSIKRKNRNLPHGSPELPRELIEKKFDCKINYDDIVHVTQVYNRSLVAMMKKHPELYGGWSTDVSLFPFYFSALNR